MKNLWAILAVLFAFVLIACGGKDVGGRAMSAEKASAVFTVQWPSSNTRFIANKADLVRIIVYRGLNVSGTAMVNKPGNGTTSTLTISDVPADEPLLVLITAEVAGSNPVQVLSKASETLTLKPGPNSVDFTLESVVDSIAITSPSSSVAVGGTLPLSAVGKSGSATVLSDKGDFEWSSSNAGVATVDPASGVVTGVADGLVTIKAFQAGNEFNAEHAQTIQITVGTGGTSTTGGLTGGTTSGATTGGSTGGGTGNGVFSFIGQTTSGIQPTTTTFTSVQIQIPGQSNPSSPPLNTITSGLVNLNVAPNIGTVVFTNGLDTMTITFDSTASSTGGISSIASPGTVTGGTGVFAIFIGGGVDVTSNSSFVGGYNFFTVIGDIDH